MINIPSLGDPWDAVWETLVDLQEQYPDGWTLIGAQMVALHGMEHGRMPPRRSQDADVLANVRAIQGATRRLSQRWYSGGSRWTRPTTTGSRIGSGPTGLASTCWRPTDSGDAPTWAQSRQPIRWRCPVAPRRSTVAS